MKYIVECLVLCTCRFMPLLIITRYTNAAYQVFQVTNSAHQAFGSDRGYIQLFLNISVNSNVSKDLIGTAGSR